MSRAPASFFWIGVAFAFASVILRVFTAWAYGLLAVAAILWIAVIWAGRR